ncbi:hypothetical protein XU06_21140 [Rhodococcus erythropolis]|uniref:hypothetical protein n=1 Tax=Rhodococcus erythropolis TaxID=1833 RepID=UPI00061B6A7B|nr:hypothetical protein [Rhodococcus erythropolis]AKD98913.1 hypothetical protein XU06_21140 [Rhodococcus erythropolis]OXM17857.1 hypothetical protein CBI33_28875 [Rhodococcus erythropolis]
MSETVIEVSIVAAPSVLWPALRDPSLIRRWFGWEYDGLDDEIAQIYSTAEADPEALTLKLGNGDRFSLLEQDGKTVVRIDRPAKSADDDWYDDITEGWTTFLQLLRFAVERHGLAERRTIYLDGLLLPGENAATVLGLTEIELEAGSRYAATITPGDYFEGVVDYVTDHQFGLTVEDLGPGLLSVATQSVTPQRPDGGMSILLTTYDLSDDEFDEIKHHWSSWWEGRRQEG